MIKEALLFRGGKLFDGRRFLPASDLRTDMHGIIREIGTGLKVESGERSVDLQGRWLLPGLVDCHVHFREPGLVRKEGYATGSAGALHGGVTTVLEIQNNPPLLTSLKLLQEKRRMLQGVSRVDYGCYANLVEEALTELPAMQPFTPAAKCFLGCSTGLSGIADEEDVRRLFLAAAKAGLRIVAHCEDDAIMNEAKERLQEPERSWHHCRRPPEAEIESIRMALRVAREVGADLHVFHISTAEGVRLVEEAKAAGQKTSCSSAPHYLLWSDTEARAASQNRLKVNPSIKSRNDQERLHGYLEKGRITCVGTDHAPHPLTEKDRPYDKAPSGFPSIDLLLPLMIAVHDRYQVPLERVLSSVTRDAADEFGLQQKGRLEVGADADLVIADPHANRSVAESQLPSKSKWSPYHGQKLRAFAQQVWLRGSEVFRDGDLLGDPIGQPLY